MSPFNDQLFSKGPTMLLPSQHGQLFGAERPPDSAPFSDGNDVATSSSYINHSSSWRPTAGQAPVSTNPSRKRSRDETSYESVSADGSYLPSQTVATPAPIPEEEPIYGEGMTLLNPRTGMSIAAESQTGTWYEEKTEAESINRIVPPEDVPVRPEMPTSRKSQRLDPTAPKLDDVAQLVAPDSPSKTVVEPPIDDFTLSLGIGWTRMANEDAAVQAAARGWAKYIDNHYSSDVHGAEILLRSNGLNAYLVGAHEGFFLFSDDLSEGRFIASTWNQTLANLRHQPMAFDRMDVLRAVKTPNLEGGGAELLNGAIASPIQDGINGTWSVNAVKTANGHPAIHESSLADGGMDID